MSKAPDFFKIASAGVRGGLAGGRKPSSAGRIPERPEGDRCAWDRSKDGLRPAIAVTEHGNVIIVCREGRTHKKI